MRISDWSSDVCSSDLMEGARKLRQALHLRLFRWRPDHARRRCGVSAARSRREAGGAPHIAGRTLDRKSVVEGKSVSVRGELGGRRILKNDTLYKNSHEMMV